MVTKTSGNFRTTWEENSEENKKRQDRNPAMSGKRDSDPRPLAWEANALPTELFPQTIQN